jgi:hypothetical protein
MKGFLDGITAERDKLRKLVPELADIKGILYEE